MWTAAGTCGHTGTLVTPLETGPVQNSGHSPLLADASVRENCSVPIVLADLQLCAVSFSCHPRAKC